MIISASYKTDIPAFYGQWFINRLRAGYCLTTQPYNGRTLRVSLLPEDVDGFVFWTKNIGPFQRHLPEIRTFGKPFTIQYTINGYPRRLESTVVSPTSSIRHMHRLANDFGPHVCVWRYDPILFSSLTDAAFHRDNFSSLAKRLRATDEVVISFAHYYRKTEINLRRASAQDEFTWHDPSTDIKKQLVANLCAIAGENEMRLSLCSQPDYRSANAGEARCIDVDRLAAIAGHAIKAPVRGNRPACLCHASRDIGVYDSCPHGCIYCYAVRDHAAAAQRYDQHDSKGEFLFPPKTKSELNYLTVS